MEKTSQGQSVTPEFSVIVPVFNRPDEIRELLESILQGKGTHTLEVIVVEDGSEITCRQVCKMYSDKLNLHYITQPNTGPGGARNTGAKHAKGNWLLFFDSDVLVPDGYFSRLAGNLDRSDVDLFGGPDTADSGFAVTQRAIDYAMTSFITTGGIRGGKKSLDTYYPRTFNMGVRRDAFLQTEGFSGLRFGEDLDLGMRLIEAGYKVACFTDNEVIHKRRANLKQFFKQVYNSGMARVVLNRLHPGTMNMLHCMPSLFVLFCIGAIGAAITGFVLPLLLVLAFWVVLAVDALFKTGSTGVALAAPIAATVQLSAYGLGLFHAFLLVYLLGKREPRAFEKTFYK